MDTEDLVYQAVQEYAEAVRAAVAGLSEEAMLEGVEAAVTRTAREELQASWERAMRAGMQLSGESALAQYNIPGSFTLDNPYSEPWIRTHGAQLVVEVDQETREALRALVGEGLQEQRTVRDTARLVRDSVGLTSRDALAVAGLQQRVMAEAGARAAANAAREYAEELLNRRAMNIARTETMNALNQGTWDSWSTASDEGLLPVNIQRVWIASPGGERLCAMCGALHKKRTGLKAPWLVKTAKGVVTIWCPPGHPSCRCTMGLALPKNWNRRR